MDVIIDTSLPNPSPYWKRRALFTTTNREQGLGPIALKAGDLIATIEGFSNVVALRRQDDFYLFVGVIYVESWRDPGGFSIDIRVR